MGERGDIIRTMQRAFAGRGDAPAPADRVIYDPSVSGARGLVGRVVERGLSDELPDRHYLIVEATDGRTHYVDIGRGDAPATLATDPVIVIAPVAPGPRPADRTTVSVAKGNAGRAQGEPTTAHQPPETKTL